MKFSKKILANTLALASGISWVVCTVLVALFPKLSLKITQDLMHGMELGDWQLNLSNFISGLVFWVIAGWLFGRLLGWSYDRFRE